MTTTGVITMVQHKGMGEKGLHWAECISRKQDRGKREARGEDLDLCRTVQNTADELDQLLHGLNWLIGQEVLLVGCVEDDNGGHCHFAEEKKKYRKHSF